MTPAGRAWSQALKPGGPNSRYYVAHEVCGARWPRFRQRRIWPHADDDSVNRRSASWHEVGDTNVPWRPPPSALVVAAMLWSLLRPLINADAPFAVLCIVALCAATPAIGSRPDNVHSMVSLATLEIVLIASSGVTTALVLGGLLAGWLLLTDQLVTDWRPLTDRTPLALAPISTATIWVGIGFSLTGALLLLISAAVTIFLDVAKPRFASTMVMRVGRVGRFIGRCLGALVMAPVGLIVSMVWLARQIVRYDPFRDTKGGWLPRIASDNNPTRQYSSAVVPHRRARRLHRFSANALLALFLLAGCAAVGLRPAPVPESRAFDSQVDFEDLWAEMWTFSKGVRFDATTTYKADDFAGELVNQTDGVRTTWAPPPCGCNRLKVWWFGGSAAWGYYQSDLTSLPSQLAKVAWEHDIALDIENRAFPGYTLSQETQQFAWLGETEPPPDIAVFYDGANELDFQVARNDAGRGTDESPVTYIDQPLDLLFRMVGQAQRLVPRSNGGTILPQESSDPVLDAPDLADHALARYRRGVRVGERTALAIGVDPIFLWQPTQTTAPSAIYAPFEGNVWQQEDLTWWRRYSEAGRQGLPPQVVDLSDSLDGLNEPIMPDWAHTNEVGAEVIARAMFGRLRQRLVAREAVGAPQPG